MNTLILIPWKYLKFQGCVSEQVAVAKGLFRREGSLVEKVKKH